MKPSTRQLARYADFLMSTDCQMHAAGSYNTLTSKQTRGRFASCIEFGNHARVEIPCLRTWQLSDTDSRYSVCSGVFHAGT